MATLPRFSSLIYVVPFRDIFSPNFSRFKTELKEVGIFLSYPPSLTKWLKKAVEK